MEGGRSKEEPAPIKEKSAQLVMHLRASHRDERNPTMQTDCTTDGDGQRTQVGPSPLDYVLRYAAGDYDCYFQGRYVGSRATLPKAIETIRYVQEKAARHPLPTHAEEHTIAAYLDELRAITARLHDLADQLAAHPTEGALISTHLTMACISIAHALKNVQTAERSLALAQRAADLMTPRDTAI
jgi:hypothetical protein